MVEPMEELESVTLDDNRLTRDTWLPVVHSFNHVYIYFACISFAHIAYKCHVLMQLIVLCDLLIWDLTYFPASLPFE